MEVPHEQLEQIVTKLQESAKKAQKLVETLKRPRPAPHVAPPRPKR